MQASKSPATQTRRSKADPAKLLRDVAAFNELVASYLQLVSKGADLHVILTVVKNPCPMQTMRSHTIIITPETQPTVFTTMLTSRGLARQGTM